MKCAHCGRSADADGRVMGSLSYGMFAVKLCHANTDGTKSDPDCYHLVTVAGEKLGLRKAIQSMSDSDLADLIQDWRSKA
jgi:hypothetical protein